MTWSQMVNWLFASRLVGALVMVTEPVGASDKLEIRESWNTTSSTASSQACTWPGKLWCEQDSKVHGSLWVSPSHV